jgi:hypothetical protein
MREKIVRLLFTQVKISAAVAPDDAAALEAASTIQWGKARR